MVSRAQQVPLTRRALTELRDELEYLRTTRRREIAETIRDAWESELDKDFDVAVPFEGAKEDQAFVEGRISAIEQLLSQAVVLDEDAARRSDTVTVGSVVVLCDEHGKETQYQVVSAAESAPAAGRLSIESPVGASIMGRRAGDQVAVRTPSGLKRLTIAALR